MKLIDSSHVSHRPHSPRDFTHVKRTHTGLLVAVSLLRLLVGADTLHAADTTTATNLEMELRAFTAAAGVRLLPPWSPAATGPAYERQRAARQVWLRLDRELGGYWLRPEVKALNKKITTADRRDETNEVARLTAERGTVMRDLAAQDQARLRAELARLNILIHVCSQPPKPKATSSRRKFYSRAGCPCASFEHGCQHGSKKSAVCREGVRGRAIDRLARDAGATRLHELEGRAAWRCVLRADRREA